MDCDLFLYDCEPGELAAFQQAADHYDITIRYSEEAVERENAALAKGCRCVSVTHKTNITEEILREWKRLGITYLSTRSIGYNHIDMSAAKRLGITVENVMYSPNSVAEYTIMLILMMLRNQKPQLEMTKAHDFSLQAKRGRELGELTVGVVGYGRIGKSVIEKLRAFGCQIRICDEYCEEKEAYVSYEQLLAESDIITYHVPLTDDTRHMLNRKNMRKLKDACCIINTSRGAVIERTALIENLQKGKIAGAALDVVEHDENYFYRDCRGEQIDAQLETLCAMDNVIITPHNAFYTTTAQQDMIENSVANCHAYLAPCISAARA